MESRRRNPLRRYPTAVCISVLHFGLTHSKTRALNSPGIDARSNDMRHYQDIFSIGKTVIRNPALVVASITVVSWVLIFGAFWVAYNIFGLRWVG